MKPTYESIYDFDSLALAYKKCRKGCRYKVAALRYHAEYEENLINLQNHLIWKSWQPGKAKFFTVTDPKMRQITAPPFADRVLHHSLHQAIETSFEKVFISDSYACRKGKGVYQASDRLQDFLRRAKRNYGDQFYVIKCDIKSYFASIRHDILLAEFSRVISDTEIQWAFNQAIKGYGFEGGIGMPVGALTSQLSGNILLNKLDHVIKDRWGIKYYLRYMDDFILLVENKQKAQELFEKIKVEVCKIGLRLNPKSSVFPWQRGVDFCGYRTWPTHKLPRKRTVKRARARIKKTIEQFKKGKAARNDIKAHVCSFAAYMNQCDGHKTLSRILEESVF